MNRSQIREQVFKLLFRVEFNKAEDMPEQVQLFMEAPTLDKDVDDSDFEDYDMENYDFKHNLLNLNITYKACSSRLGATSNLNNHSVNETKKDSNPNTESIEHAKKAKSVLKSINLPSENQSNYDKNISGNNNEKSNNEENKQGNNYLTIISIILVLILVIIACKKLY